MLLLTPPVCLLFLVVMTNFLEQDKAAYIEQRRSDLHQPVFPAFAAHEILLKKKGFGPNSTLIPLTGPANSETIFCREDEKYLQYRSDRHGFHNLDAIWDAPQWDAIFVGDSFVQGACVDSDKNFVSLYQSAHGISGNLGSYGNGPLTQLASLIEYAKDKRPKKVFWIYMQNDLFIDLSIESRNKTLMAYLDGTTQDLIGQQNLFEPELTEYLNQTLSQTLQNKSWRDLFSFKNIFTAMGKIQQKLFYREPKSSLDSDFLRAHTIDWTLFRKIMLRATKEVQLWGGEFYFVILPSAEMVLPKNQALVSDLKNLLSLSISDLDLHIIDAHHEFMKDLHPLRYFNPMGSYYSHFNEKGYQLAAQVCSLR